MFEDRGAFTHAGGVVRRESSSGRRFLIARSAKNREHWILPKGHVERGETLEAAALREVREETGVESAILAPLGESSYTFGGERCRIAYFALTFVAEHAPLEARELRWSARDEALELLSFEDARELVRRADRLA